MNTQSSRESQLPAIQPLYWSVRRELWEYRSIYIAPLAVGALGLSGFVFTLIHPPKSKDMGLAAINPTFDPTGLAMPYSHAAMLLLLTAFIVVIFYCLDALYGERRDRSILFWKSLPVSDLTTVLAKASIPLAVVPLTVFAITVALQLTMLLLSIVTLLMSGGSVATLWRQLPLFQLQAVLLYSSGRHHALVCAHLRVVAADLRLGAAHHIPLGAAAADGYRPGRVHCLPHHAFRIVIAPALLRIRSQGFRLQEARRLLDRSPLYSDNPNYSGEIPEQPRSVDRAGLRRRIPSYCSPAAPLSGTNLISQSMLRRMYGKRDCS